MAKMFKRLDIDQERELESQVIKDPEALEDGLTYLSHQRAANGTRTAALRFWGRWEYCPYRARRRLVFGFSWGSALLATRSTPGYHIAGFQPSACGAVAEGREVMGDA